jgi:hypothetical protein
MADELKDEIEEFSQYQDHWAETRNTMLEDLKFARLGEQWDEKTRDDRMRQGRPVLTINKMPSFARQIVNEARLNKPSIKIHPADDKADVKTAEVMNGLIRNIEYCSNAEVAYDTGLEYAVYCGVGYFRIDVEYSAFDSFEQDLVIERITNPLSVYGDINSTAADASDWDKCWITEMVSRESFELDYPDADPVSFSGDYDESWTEEDDIRLAERWVRNQEETDLLMLNNGEVLLQDDYEPNKELLDSMGIVVVNTRKTTQDKVTKYLLTASEILDTTEYPGKYIPIVPVYGEEFTVEGKRYFQSMFRHAKDSQRMFNYWRTNATELVALAPKTPYIGKKGSFDSDAANWATANTENHPYLEYEGDITPERQPLPQIPVGALQEASSADMDMKSIIGIFDPGLGDNQKSDMSGKAIHEWKVESDTSNFHFLDNLSRSMRYAGRVLLDLIPHVYNEQRIIRIMGSDGEPENVPIGQQYESEGQSRVNDFSAGKYDLTVQTGPSFTTRRQEALKTMQSMVASAPGLMQVVGDLIAKNMDWDGADEIAKRLKAMLPPQVAALENMQDIPEEARAFVANAQGQLQQMQQTIQQKDTQLAEYDQATKQLQLRLESKEGELQIKGDANAIKLEIAQLQESNKEDMTILKGEIEKQIVVLKDQLEPIVHLYAEAG